MPRNLKSRILSGIRAHVQQSKQAIQEAWLTYFERWAAEIIASISKERGRIGIGEGRVSSVETNQCATFQWAWRWIVVPQVQLVREDGELVESLALCICREKSLPFLFGLETII